MNYNKTCGPKQNHGYKNGIGEIFAPVFQTLANEVEKEISNNKNFMYMKPLTNIINLDTAIEIQMTIPGLSKEEITIAVEKNQLIVSANNEEQTEANFKRREFKFGVFKKVFNLAENINTDAIKATVHNGILKITLEKIAEKQAKKIEIL